MAKKRITQLDQVLQYLRLKGSITSMEAIGQFHATRLSAIILNLKKLGYRFDTKMETSTNIFGMKVSFARYHLIHDVRHDEFPMKTEPKIFYNGLVSEPDIYYDENGHPTLFNEPEVISTYFERAL